MNIKESKEICGIFDIFHDGILIQCYMEDGHLCLEVEILYLTQLIDSRFEKFFVRLLDAYNVHFVTWPNDASLDAEIIRDLSAIAKAELEILSGKLDGELVQIMCRQGFPERFGFVGGVFNVVARKAEVRDEAGKMYSYQALANLANDYWRNSSR